MTKRLQFFNQDGKEIDICEEDIIMGIDLVKNVMHSWMRDTETPDSKSAIDSLFRLNMFLHYVRVGLRPSEAPADNQGPNTERG